MKRGCSGCELGYPSRKNLRRWYRTYVETGGLPKGARPTPKYSIEQKQRTVDHYLSHERCLARTRRALGYPCVELLGKWIDELHPGWRRRFIGKARGMRAQKQHAVIEQCSRQRAASAVASRVGVSRQVLYKPKNQLLDDEKPIVHSDRGAHYRWPGRIPHIEGPRFIRSMSRKGCTPDNAACEGFFGRLKTKFFYPRDWRGTALEQFMAKVDSYICWYHKKRIKVSLGSLSPLEYRETLGIAA